MDQPDHSRWLMQRPARGGAFLLWPGTVHSERPVAAFDFDGTLVPYRGRGPDPAVTANFLERMIASGFNVVIFSNRNTQVAASAGIAPRVRPIANWLSALSPAVASEITACASIGDDRCRKPQPGMWEEYARWTALPGSFYCGDAAGLEGDHSASDRMFAHNIGLPFVTPQALFGRVGYRLSLDFPRNAWRENFPPMPLPGAFLRPADEYTEALRRLRALLAGRGERRICVIMVGAPGSGKSKIAREIELDPSFATVSNDLQRNAATAFLACIRRGVNVVVDNTSPDRASRAQYGDNAHRHGYQVIVCHADTPKEACQFLVAYRCMTTGRAVPAIAQSVWHKRYVPVTGDELGHWGDATLVTVPFALTGGDIAALQRYRF